jgi:hypothetical protein
LIGTGFGFGSLKIMVRKFKVIIGPKLDSLPARRMLSTQSLVGFELLKTLRYC